VCHVLTIKVTSMSEVRKKESMNLQPFDTISAEEFNKLQDQSMSENALLAQVLQVLKVNDWYVHHVFEQRNRARRTDKGFPDINATTTGGRIIYAELKREKEKPTPDQISWLDRLAKNIGVEVYLVKPSTRQEFYDCLNWNGKGSLKVNNIAWKGGEL